MTMQVPKLVSWILIGATSFALGYFAAIRSTAVQKTKLVEIENEMYFRTPSADSMGVAKLVSNDSSRALVEGSLRSEIRGKYALILKQLLPSVEKRDYVVVELIERETDRLRFLSSHEGELNLDQTEVAAIDGSFYLKLSEKLSLDEVDAWKKAEKTLPTWRKLQTLAERCAISSSELSSKQISDMYLILKSEPIGRIPDFADEIQMYDFLRLERAKRRRFSDKAVAVLSPDQLQWFDNLMNAEVDGLEIAYLVSRQKRLN